MRQGFIAAALFAAGSLVLSPVQAATKSSGRTAAPKIVVVDLQQVIARSQRGQEASNVLKKKQDEMQSQANDLNDKRKAMKDQLDKADAKSANYAQLTKQFQDADSAFNNFVSEARQLLQQRQQELLQPIQEELQSVVPQFVKDNHIDILLAKNSGALTVTDQYDVTTQVIAAMDKDWAQVQKSAPVPTPAPAASTKR